MWVLIMHKSNNTVTVTGNLYPIPIQSIDLTIDITSEDLLDILEKGELVCGELVI